MTVYFVTPTRISYIDLITMGGSEKAGDETKIGQFASGLKYAMALMLRNGVDFEVTTFKDTIPQSIFNVCDYQIEDGDTGKSKKLIGIRERNNTGDDYIHHTGFSVDLGLGWEIWMAMREIFSNVRDEDGYYTSVFPEIDCGTVMKLAFDESSPFYEVWENRHLYINEETPLYKATSQLDVYENKEKYLKIFKQGVLVHEDRGIYSEWGWGIHFGEIDERRLLNNVTGVISDIAAQVARTKNVAFIQELVRSEEWVDKKDFLNDIYFYGFLSDELQKAIWETEGGFTYEFLHEKARDAKDSPMAGRQVRSLSDHLYAYTSTVTIEETKEEISQKDDNKDLKSLIEKLYKFDVNCEVKCCEMKGSNVIADKHNKTLLVGEDFDPEEESQFAKFIIQYLDLTQTGNIMENLSKMLVQQLKR